MPFYKQSFIIVEGPNADAVSERVTEYLNAGYDLHGELLVVGKRVIVNTDGTVQHTYAQAVVKHGERCYG